MTYLAMTAGWIGALLLLTGYLLVSIRRLAGNSVLFQTLNVVGSIGLAGASVAGGVWPSAAVNAVWIGVGVVILVRQAVGRRATTREAQTFPEDGQRK
jgi:hypothetical protein